jgi:hypothetical protein
MLPHSSLEKRFISIIEPGHHFLSIVIVLLSITNSAIAQTYNMAPGTVNICGGTFYDPGGSGSNYGNNLNITETFCSNAGSCIQVAFTAFNTQGGNDILTIYDGPNTASPVIGAFSGNGGSPGTVTSSTGCLTFQFVTNGSTTRSGWTATLSCVPCGSTILMNNTAENLCSGIFYDSGGSGANYGNSQNFTKTFCSPTAGMCVQLIFTSFNVSNNDYLYAYDGNSVAAPLIGQYTGTTLPPTLLASSGCLTIRFTSNNAGNSAGWQAILSCEPCPTPPGAATYTHPTTGQQNTYVGTNMVATCGGTYTDNGGTGANYTNNINGVYRTFCPSSAGNCMRATFWSFDVEPAGVFLYDYLTIRNGPTQNSPEFGGVGGSTWYGTATSYAACMGAGLGPYISTDQSGCLTFSFTSDVVTNRAGWVVTLDCVPCANGPNGSDNSDCRSPSPICSDVSFSDASTGPGIVSDGGGGCVLSENFSNWYKITIANSGTLGLRIVPNVATDDYDFALYQANTCAGLGSPVRCSYASNTGNTGMDNALNLSTNTAICGPANNGSDVSEDVCGNGWVNDMAVTTGQNYYLLVNKWTPGGSGFTLDWVLGGGATLNCSVLPIELLDFTAEARNDRVDLQWSTSSESNNSFFTVERSRDARSFEPIQVVPGAGNSSTTRYYLASDFEPLPGIAYYRLRQTDFDGKFTFSEPVAVRYRESVKSLFLVPNPASDRVQVLFECGVETNGSLRIFSLEGKLISQRQLSLRRGMNAVDLDLSRWKTGSYVVELLTSDEVLRQRLLHD